MTIEPHTLMLVFGLLAVLLFLYILRSLRRMSAEENAFELRDLLMENGRASKAAVVLMGAFAATTWMFIYYTLIGKMSEGFFGIYGALWVTPVVARMITNAAPPVGARHITTETKL